MQKPSLRHPPLAWFLSWRTYGTWLQGDPRGWQTRYTRGVLPPDEVIYARCRERMQHPPMRLTHEEQALVESAVRETCEYRSWSIRTLLVRSEHVHIVVCAPVTPERVLQSLKSWATRRLRAHSPSLVERPIWSEHGSTRYLYTPSEVERAVAYVLDDHHGE